jgi:hypothetical protein
MTDVKHLNCHSKEPGEFKTESSGNFSEVKKIVFGERDILTFQSTEEAIDTVGRLNIVNSTAPSFKVHI